MSDIGDDLAVANNAGGKADRDSQIDELTREADDLRAENTRLRWRVEELEGSIEEWRADLGAQSKLSHEYRERVEDLERTVNGDRNLMLQFARDAEMGASRIDCVVTDLRAAATPCGGGS